MDVLKYIESVKNLGHVLKSKFLYQHRLAYGARYKDYHLRTLLLGDSPFNVLKA